MGQLSIRILSVVLISLIAQSGFAKPKQSFGSMVLVGNVPVVYLGKPTKEHRGKYKRVALHIHDGVITKIEDVSKDEALAALKSTKEIPVIKLQPSAKAEFDVIYPGLFNMHNHVTQNMLSMWDEAKGQFANRYEWRNWKSGDINHYGNAVGNNMNPWIKMGGSSAPKCAAFRWSELQAMVLGTTFLQGDLECSDNFGIHQVEDGGAYRFKKTPTENQEIQGAGDIIATPDSFQFLWVHIRGRMLKLAGLEQDANWEAAVKKGKTYDVALTSLINEFCPSLNVEDAGDPSFTKTISETTGKKLLEASCKDYPASFIRYVNYYHPPLITRRAKLRSGAVRSLITHLAEGRREDPLSKLEMQMLRIIGLDVKGAHVNIIHGVSFDRNDFKHMAQQEMGLIWSPTSNFLLYNETARIRDAHDAGVVISIGSDWTPTGTRSVLHEIKIARDYIQKDPNKEGLKEIFDDEYLVRMMTENAAKMIGHDETDPEDNEHGLGTIAEDAAATLSIFRRTNDNAFTNLVLATDTDVNLVIVDGKPVYGNRDYLESYYGNPEEKKNLEDLPVDFPVFNTLTASDMPSRPAKDEEAELGKDHVIALAKAALKVKGANKDQCQFPEQKAWVLSQSDNKKVSEFREKSGLDLERATDIHKFLAVNLMTQGKNAQPYTNEKDGDSEGEPDFRPTYFPSLHSCNDAPYQTRVAKFVSEEIASSKENRPALRKTLPGNTVLNICKAYELKDAETLCKKTNL